MFPANLHRFHSSPKKRRHLSDSGRNYNSDRNDPCFCRIELDPSREYRTNFFHRLKIKFQFFSSQKMYLHSKLINFSWTWKSSSFSWHLSCANSNVGQTHFSSKFEQLFDQFFFAFFHCHPNLMAWSCDMQYNLLIYKH